jgi:hypothetical protein
LPRIMHIGVKVPGKTAPHLASSTNALSIGTLTHTE